MFSAYALALAAATNGADVAPVRWAQVTIRQRVIMRIPALPPRNAAKSAPAWREKKGPKCVPMNSMAGAAVTRPDAVDLFFRGGARVRAQLENACPALDFYSGFYLKPTSDGMVCADRDSIHSRAGGECRIDRFRQLVPPK